VHEEGMIFVGGLAHPVLANMAAPRRAAPKILSEDDNIRGSTTSTHSL
jgi:hypothetical protein